MKRYLGTAVNIFCAVFLIALCIFILVFGIFILSEDKSTGSITASVFCIVCFLYFLFYSIKVSNQLFAWGTFKENGVEIFVPFKKKYIIEYSKCVDVGMAYYVHGIMNSKNGTKFTYIYLSYNLLDEKYKDKINLVKPSENFIKFGFTEKTYKYLIDVLPEKQSKMLKRNRDYHYDRIS